MRRKRVAERVRRKSRIMTATTKFLAFLITLKKKKEGLFIYKICHNQDQTHTHTHTHTKHTHTLTCGLIQWSVVFQCVAANQRMETCPLEKYSFVYNKYTVTYAVTSVSWIVIRSIQLHKFSNIHLFLIYATRSAYSFSHHHITLQKYKR
jgi:hypothetical protein